MVGCIYCLTNKINGKKYIGQTINMQRRIIQHKYYDDIAVDKAITKYGYENFGLEIIHNDIPIERLDDWEKYYINEIYNTYLGRGYNCTLGGHIRKSVSEKDIDDEAKKRLERMKQNSDKGLNHYKAYVTNDMAKEVLDKRVEGKSILQIEKETNISDSIVSKIINDKHYSTKKLDYDFDELPKKIDYNQGLDNSCTKVDYEFAKEIIEYRKKTFKTKKEIAEYFELGCSTIGKIIQGKHFTCEEINEDFSKLENIGKCQFDKEQMINVYKLYHTSGLSIKDSGRKYDLSYGTSYQICKDNFDFICLEDEVKLNGT